MQKNDLTRDFNLDSLTKRDGDFPAPEANQILICDGFGGKFKRASEYFPKNILEGVLTPIDEITFYGLFSNEPLVSAARYQLPEHLYIEPSPDNDRWQLVKHRTTGDHLFSVLYSRDYDHVEIFTLELLLELGFYAPDFLSRDIKEVQLDFKSKCREYLID